MSDQTKARLAVTLWLSAYVGVNLYIFWSIP